MANNENILPNSSMNSNDVTNLSDKTDTILKQLNSDANINNGSKHYYYNLDTTNNIIDSRLQNVFSYSKNVLDKSGNKNISNYLDDAIENAACGNWESNNGICSGVFKDPSGNYNYNYINTNGLHDPSSNYVKLSLDNFINSDDNILPSEPKVNRSTFNRAINYLISKIIVDKARYYNTSVSNNNNNKYSGFDGFSQTYYLMSNQGQVAKIFCIIVYIVTIYLLIIGFKSISVSNTNNIGTKKKQFNENIQSAFSSNITYIFSSTFSDKKSFFIFIITLFLVFSIGGYVFSKKSTFYILSDKEESYFNHRKNFLTNPCVNEKDSNSPLNQTIFFIIIILISLLLQNYSSNFVIKFTKNFDISLLFFYVLYYISFISLVIVFFKFSIIPKTNDDTDFIMSYQVENENENSTLGTKLKNFFLPYKFGHGEQINLPFYGSLFIIILITTIASIIISLFNSNNNNPYFKLLFPFLSLRSSIVTVLSLIILYKIPYVFIIYPLIIMIQRLVIGNFIAPIVLDKVFQNSKSTNKGTESFIFETLVGWDLLGWPLFKIADVIESQISGSKDLEELANKNSSSNLNVFTSFKKELGFNSILKIIMFASPISLAQLFNKSSHKYEKFFPFLLSIVILIGTLYLISYIFIWSGEGAKKYFDNKYVYLISLFNITYKRNIVLIIFLILWGYVFMKNLNYDKWITAIILGLSLLSYAGIPSNQ